MRRALYAVGVEQVPRGSLSMKWRAAVTASTDGIEDADGLGGFAFQWIADDAVRRIKVRASVIEDAGQGEAVTSGGTAPVERPPLTAAGRDVPA